jgi:predicted acetyltransferase
MVSLIKPNLTHLYQYKDALEAGWSPDTNPKPKHDVGSRHLLRIRKEPSAFVRELAADGRTTRILFDGASVPEISEKVLWISDGDFCGAISLRFLIGSLDLPAEVSGHVSYAVVPWKRRRGYAVAALTQLIPVACGLGLPRLLLTTHEDNEASRRVIEASGGVLDAAIPHPNQRGKRRLVFWLRTDADAHDADDRDATSTANRP